MSKSRALDAQTALKHAISKEVSIDVLGQMQAILGKTHIQQPINCCQSTAIAFALSCLGFETTVDDILHTVKVNIDSAVGKISRLPYS